uniref:Uncharacterized protein n=1 Tax=Anguilla anguilla TaxID=7936 RepID=A0A0E9VPL4_ANGAN
MKQQCEEAFSAGKCGHFKIEEARPG